MTDIDPRTTLSREELIRLSVEAMQHSRDADALLLLKWLVVKHADEPIGHYLLGAMHAQLGMWDEAEAGFRQSLAIGGAPPMARFQLGQLLLTRGRLGEAAVELQAMAGEGSALGQYAAGLARLAAEDVEGGVALIEAGLAMPQAPDAMQSDMRRLVEDLRAGRMGGGEPPAPTAPAAEEAIGPYLGQYARHQLPH